MAFVAAQPLQLKQVLFQSLDLSMQRDVFLVTTHIWLGILILPITPCFPAHLALTNVVYWIVCLDMQIDTLREVTPSVNCELVENLSPDRATQK